VLEFCVVLHQNLFFSNIVINALKV